MTEALGAMRKLLRRPEWRGSAHAAGLCDQLTARLDAPERHLRYLAVLSLPAVHTDSFELAKVLAARIDAETDTDVLTGTLSMLNKHVPCSLADPVLATAARARAAGPSITHLVTNCEAEQHDLLNFWVTAHLNCMLHEATPHSTVTVNAWFSDPAATGTLFRAAVASLRGVFGFEAEGTNRNKAFNLVRAAATALGTQLAAASTETSVVLAADALIEQLYFASGAFTGANKAPRPTDDQKARWFADAMAALEDLTAVRHPHSCYQLLETLEFLVDENPERVFRAVASTIHDDSDFRYESMGVEVAVRIIDRYLAEYRQLFLSQPEILGELRRVLEIFATVGWPAALHLSYSLGDVFR